MRRTCLLEAPVVGRSLRQSSWVAVALVLFVAALGSADPLAAQRPKNPGTPPPEGRITRAPPDLVGAVVPCDGCSNRKRNVVVANTGGTNAVGAVKVELYFRGALVASKVFDGVPPHGRRSVGTLTCTPLSPTPGNHPPPSCEPVCPEGAPNSYIVVDATNAVAESNETNNVYAFCWWQPSTFEAAP
jgi:hypothetical protein